MCSHVTYLAPSVDACIHQLLERIELQHGRLLVSHAFSYMTVSKEGLTESEQGLTEIKEGVQRGTH